MPDRLIRDGLKTSARVGAVSERAEMIFTRLMLTVCPLGRYHAEPALVKSGALPNRPRMRLTDVASCLDELERAGLIVLWTDSGSAAYLMIPRFGQRLRFEVRSPFPAPPRGAPDVPGQEVLEFAADPPEPEKPPPLRQEEKRSEVKGARGARDTRHACNCIPELRKRWPRHDIEENLRRAQSQVRQKRGPSAVVTMWWFEEHWLAREPEQETTDHGPRITQETPEPEGWRDWITGSGLSWAAAALATGWPTMPAHWKRKISDEMREAA